LLRLIHRPHNGIQPAAEISSFAKVGCTGEASGYTATVCGAGVAESPAAASMIVSRGEFG